MTFIIFSNDHIIIECITPKMLMLKKKKALGNIIMTMSFFPCQKVIF